MKSSLHILICFCLAVSGCSNIYEAMSNKTTDEALYEDVQNLMDKQEWDEAIAKFANMSSAYKAKTEVIEAWTGVLAGKCGLNFLEYFESISNASLTGSTIFKYFMNQFTDKTIYPDYCRQAQLKMEEISTNPANRTAGQNLFMAVLGMVKMGVYLRYYTDRDGAASLGDGTAEKDVCTNDASNLPQAALDEVITGFGLLTSNLVYVSAALSGGTSLTTTLDAVCNNGVTGGACGKTSTATLAAADRNLFIDILATSATHPVSALALGVGSCVNLDATTCCGNTY